MNKKKVEVAVEVVEVVEVVAEEWTVPKEAAVFDVRCELRNLHRTDETLIALQDAPNIGRAVDYELRQARGKVDAAIEALKVLVVEIEREVAD